MHAIKHALMLILLLSGTASAASECFCLTDDVDNIRYGCFTQQKGYQQETRCLDERGDEFPVTNLKPWTKIADGTGRCAPCKPLLKPDDGSDPWR